MNVFLRSLERLCRRRPFEEKHLLAPSRRVAHQWIESLARSGCAAFNLRPATVGSLALGLAGPAMLERGLALASELRRTVVVGRSWRRLRREGGYLSRLEPSYSLLAALKGMLDSLRLAGVVPADLLPDSFEAEAKGREVKALLDAYLDELRTHSLVDYAGALEMARDRVLREGFPVEGLVILPSDLRLERLEREFLAAIPAERVAGLPVDEPAEAGLPEPTEPCEAAFRRTDAWRLRWVTATSAPPPAADRPPDGTASVYAASAPSCEVREVLRKILEEGLRFDDVEILHTDYGTYVPLLYETLLSLGLSRSGAAESGDAPQESGAGVPATFAEGLPVARSRPGKALSAWLAWISEDYRQDRLAAAIADGLFEVEGLRGSGVGFAELGAELERVRAVMGRDRWLPAIDRALERAGQSPQRREEPDGPSPPDRAEKTRLALRLLKGLVAGLLEISPADGSGPRELLAGAVRFLTGHARVASGFDAICRDMLAEKIEEMLSIVVAGEEPGIDVLDWLDGLPRELRAGGQGPRPGMLHVAGILSGGHSGRPRTFVVGLDDARVQLAASQDPLLLDSERKRLSRDLPDSRRELAERTRALGRLLARLRGRVTFSYSQRDEGLEREAFPSQLFLSVLKVVPGLGTAIAPPAAFAPSDPARALDEGEWWLGRLLSAREAPSGGPPRTWQEAVARRFPHLASGLEAERMRDSAAFTVYDGFVPGLPAELDPFHERGPVMSATRLETLGRCPFSYFLEYVLGLGDPEERVRDPSRWLGPLESGELLHDVFRRFLAELLENGEVPDSKRHAGRLEAILREEIDSHRRESPPPSEEAFRRDCRDLALAARIFLAEEEASRKETRPVYLEAAIGVRPAPPGTRLDSSEPETIPLGTRGAIRACGRLDRIDRVVGRSSGAEMCTAARPGGPGGEPERYSVWDYKTGSLSRYEGARRGDPFDGGRVVQPALYLALAEARLRRLSPGARVRLFGYFFPGVRGRGERLRFSSEELEGAPRVIERLCELAARGAFVQTNEPDDCARCGLSLACGDLDMVRERSRRKLGEETNVVLEPLRELRGIGEKDEED